MPNSLSIVAYPTVSGMQRALNLNAGMALQVKYIAVGSGLQALQFDDGGRVMTDTLANLVGYVEVAAANKVSPYQWQMTINLVGLSSDEWRLSEFALCDADHNVIAIYGSATQAIYPVTPYVTDALLSVNLLMAAFPANSIVIEHHNQPLELFFSTALVDTETKLKRIGTHLRLSRNQALEPNSDGSFPKNWAGGGIYWAAVEEIVHNGADPATRSALAQEFLNAINSNYDYLGSSFWIWRMKAKIPTGATRQIGFYQGVNTSSGESTIGCVIKPISGPLPVGAMFSGTKPAPAGAQLILNRNVTWSGGRHHSYSMMHGFFDGNPGDELEFLIALPGIVTGYVPDGDGWGNFPYVNQGEL